MEAAEPHAPEERAGFDPEYYLRERYQRGGRQGFGQQAFYGLKPLMPRRLQIALRRAYAPLQARRRFPRWPIEPILVDHHREALRRRLIESGEQRVPLVNFWPGRKRFAFVLTHDVEGAPGLRTIEAVRQVERGHGLVSAWNFVAEDYSVEPRLLEQLRSEGCEIGLHGISHDGKLFQSRARFEEQLPKIRHYMAEWDAVGFRSPSLHRNADWMSELECLYDSSFPDTDPFGPQPGGCCSILPYFLDDVVELPVTLVQDHTLFEILGHRSTELWVRKSEWIIGHHGMVNLIVHPDYMEGSRLDLYAEFLGFLAGRSDGWHALPRDVATWWRDRAGLRCDPRDDGGHDVVGPGAARAGVAYAREQGEEVVVDFA